jgi:lysophospholipase L1-like esterase
MHYGDSQLEGDRITSYIRNKLQTQFGGMGPGMVSVADIVTNFSVDREISENWIRFSVMGRKDPSQYHDRFGALSSFSRFTPILPDSVQVDTVQHEATVTLRPNRRSYGKARQFSVCKLYYGWHREPLTIELRQGEELISTELVPPSEELLIRTWKFDATPEEITITFKGTDSPDVFGISLQGRTGLAMDNIAARGGAGYEFRRVDQDLLKAMYVDLDVELMILQYGGNVLPNVKDAEEAAQYGRYFGAQIARFKKMLPGLSVIVIGPSDMSIKEGEHYVTRPYLEEVRDAMKANSLAQGAVFWDMYEAMGGRNSMVSWVNAEPPLAATDYIHFSPQGAKKVGELFYTALINDFAAFYSSKQ